jgi:hypothetical protein
VYKARDTRLKRDVAIKVCAIGRGYRHAENGGGPAQEVGEGEAGEGEPVAFFGSRPDLGS